MIGPNALGGMPLGHPLHEHSYLIAFVVVLLEFSGVPISGGLVLLLISALAPTSGHSLIVLAAVSVFAALIPDTGWFLIGRRRGMGLIQLYCKVTLGSRSCAERTTRFFGRLGPKSLLLSKFVPGFSTFAAPMAGLSGISLARFWLWDGLGAVLWSGLLVAIGRSAGLGFFHSRSGWITAAGTRLHLALAATISLYLAMKLYVRARNGPPGEELGS